MWRWISSGIREYHQKWRHQLSLRACDSVSSLQVMTFGHPNNECHCTLHTVNFLFCFTVAIRLNSAQKITHPVGEGVWLSNYARAVRPLGSSSARHLKRNVFYVLLSIHPYSYLSNKWKKNIILLYDLGYVLIIWFNLYIFCIYTVYIYWISCKGKFFFSHMYRGAATHATSPVRGRCLAQRHLDHSPTTSPHHALFGLSGIWTGDLRVSKPYGLSYCLSYWHFYPCHNRKQLKPSNSINAYIAGD